MQYFRPSHFAYGTPPTFVQPSPPADWDAMTADQQQAAMQEFQAVAAVNAGAALDSSFVTAPRTSDPQWLFAAPAPRAALPGAQPRAVAFGGIPEETS